MRRLVPHARPSAAIVTAVGRVATAKIITRSAVNTTTDGGKNLCDERGVFFGRLLLLLPSADVRTCARDTSDVDRRVARAFRVVYARNNDGVCDVALPACRVQAPGIKYMCTYLVRVCAETSTAMRGRRLRIILDA